MHAYVEARHPPDTFPSLLARAVAAFPGAPAILAPGRSFLTYAQLSLQIERTVAALIQSGYGARARIGVALPDGPELAVALLATTSRLTCAPLNPQLDEATLARLFARMRLDALIVLEGHDSPARRVAQGTGIELLDLRSFPPQPAGSFELHAARIRAPETSQTPSPEDIALLMHTSGTTASPKIVPLRHRHLAESARTRIDLLQITSSDRCLLATPLYAAAGIRRSLLPPLLTGGSVVCPPPDLHPSTFVDLLEQYAPTFYAASAARQIALLEELERRPRAPAHRLRFAISMGALLPAAVQEKLERALGVPVIQGYGMTETGNIAQTPLPPVGAPIGSVGLAMNAELKVTDDAGHRLADGETGEIAVRGPEVFEGYEGDPEANASAFRDGWFRTGDLGRVDEQGFVFLVGRIKDIINRGGAKVSPSEVEAALATDPSVVEAAAFAMPHPTLGEDVAAAVVIRSPDKVTEEELLDVARARLAAYKVPTRIIFLRELPRNSFGKLKRDALADIAADALRTEFVAPRDAEEEQIAGVFSEVLRKERIGVHDNFFQVGGDSLRGAQVLSRIQARTGVLIGLSTLFRRPSVAELATEVRAARVQRAPMDPPLTALPRAPKAGQVAGRTALDQGGN